MSSSIKNVTLYDRSEAQFQTYTNMCITSKEKQEMSDGTLRRELYYLSMFGPRGSGNSVRAIFAGLVNNASSIRDILIEDIGTVALMHKSVRIPTMAPGWSCDSTEFGTNRSIHAVVESKALSLWDPQQAIAGKKSTSSPDEEDGGKATKLKQLSSKEGEISDASARTLERYPVFFLMVPPGEDASKLYLSYLDKRCPFPLIDEWAQFLWDRAFERPEIEQLEVWSFTPEGTESVISEAYLCYPDIEKMIKDISEHIRTGAREMVAA